MRRDLEEWLKGKTEILKGLEASGRYAGLPVVRLAPPPKSPSGSGSEGPEALFPDASAAARKPFPTSEDLLQGVHEIEERYGLVPQEAPAASSSASFEAGEAPEEGEVSRGPVAEETVSRKGEAEGLVPGETEEETPAESEEVSGFAAPPPEPRMENVVPHDPEALVNMPDSPPGADREPGPGAERDVRLTERLRRVTQMRRSAIEAARREEAPRRRLRLVALGVAAVLVFGAIFVLYRHMQRNSRSFVAQEAQRLYDEGHYDEAAAFYQRGFDLYPESTAFLLGLARSSERAGRSEQSLKAWRLYLDQIPSEESAVRAQALYEVGRLYALMREPGKAIEHLIRSSSLDSTSYGTHFVLGRLLEEQNRPAEALNAYRHALDVRPSSQEALDAVKRVAGLVTTSAAPDPRDPVREYEKHLEVGTVALNLKRYDEAQSYFTQALAIRSDDERPWLGLAGAYQGKGKVAEALKVLQETQSRIPESVTIEAKIGELEEDRKKGRPAAPAKRRKAPSKASGKS